MDRPVVVARVRTRLQAELLFGEMRRRGIDAQVEEMAGETRLGRRWSVVRVPEPDRETAVEVVAELTGTGARLSMFDLRRLIPALLALALLVAAVVLLVDLFV